VNAFPLTIRIGLHWIPSLTLTPGYERPLFLQPTQANKSNPLPTPGL
jgi:hypothetical protein